MEVNQHDGVTQSLIVSPTEQRNPLSRNLDKIVNHRNRHGYFTRWEELAEIKGFPAEKLEEVKAAAVLGCPDEDCSGPRHVRPHLRETRKKPAGYTKAIRSTRMSDRLKQA